MILRIKAIGGNITQKVILLQENKWIANHKCNKLNGNAKKYQKLFLNHEEFILISLLGIIRMPHKYTEIK